MQLVGVENQYHEKSGLVALGRFVSSYRRFITARRLVRRCPRSRWRL